MIEEWRTLDFLPKHFEVSNLGRFRNLKTGNILNGWVTPKGYVQLSIPRNNTTETYFMHRLVAKAFLTNTEGFDQVNHIDGNKLNNRLENLEWCNNTHNIKEAYRNNLIPQAKLTSKQRDNIVYQRDILKMKFIDIAKELGINESSVRGNYYRRKK